MGTQKSRESLDFSNRIYLETYIINNQEYLYRLAYSYVKNKDDAFEIVQNTIYKSLSSIETIHDINSIKPWITKILINSCFDFIKKNSKMVVKDEVFDSIEDNNGQILDKLVLKDAIDKLPTKLKSIIILRFFEDFKIKDISRILDINENTVKTNLYKALKILKVDLKEDCMDV